MGKICGEECEIFSRVCGYYRPIKSNGRPIWNKGKQAEFKDRKTFDLNKATQPETSLGVRANG